MDRIMTIRPEVPPEGMTFARFRHEHPGAVCEPARNLVDLAAEIIRHEISVARGVQELLDRLDPEHRRRAWKRCEGLGLVALSGIGNHALGLSVTDPRGDGTYEVELLPTDRLDPTDLVLGYDEYR